MTDLRQIITEVEQYAAASGTTPRAFCRQATGNPRLYDRLIRRAEQTDRDVRRLRELMARNTRPCRVCGAITISEHGDEQ